MYVSGGIGTIFVSGFSTTSGVISLTFTKIFALSVCQFVSFIS
jgi:hypothetical protein